LKSIGADKVVFPERDTATNIGPILTMKGVVEFIPLSNGSGIVKVKAPASFVGKPLSDIGIGTRSNTGVVLLMIQRGKEGIANPGEQEVISRVDVLILAGNTVDIDSLLEKADKPEAAGSS
jgi:trk system potassium uptake protein